MALQVEQAIDDSVGAQEALGVPGRTGVVASPCDRDEYLVDEERLAEPRMTALESLRE
jgi:hypothetical protein